MGKGHLFEQFLQQTNRIPEVIPSQPIVEIAGEHRVLIENHRGVCAYGQEKIVINVSFGSVCICGCNLEMIHMTKDQLVIYGRIESIGLQRRR